MSVLADFYCFFFFFFFFFDAPKTSPRIDQRQRCMQAGGYISGNECPDPIERKKDEMQCMERSGFPGIFFFFFFLNDNMSLFFWTFVFVFVVIIGAFFSVF